MTALGVALRYFTDIVPATATTAAELHQATAILTKQIQRCLASDDWLKAVHQLVTDPERVVLADGRTAAQLCGVDWPAVRVAADLRSTAAIDDSVRFGETTVKRLAALHAYQSTGAWWTTPAWQRRVSAWTIDRRRTQSTRCSLLRAPEYMDPIVIEAVLC